MQCASVHTADVVHCTYVMHCTLAHIDIHARHDADVDAHVHANSMYTGTSPHQLLSWKLANPASGSLTQLEMFIFHRNMELERALR